MWTAVMAICRFYKIILVYFDLTWLFYRCCYYCCRVFIVGLPLLLLRQHAH